MHSYNRPERGKLITVTLILVTVAVALHLAGYISPGWKYFSVESSEGIHVGLWYYVACYRGTCDSGSPDSFDGGGRSVKSFLYKVYTYTVYII